MDSVKLTVYSDYVCPWCYVGQGAVEKMMKEYPVEVTWRPFYLRPDTPPEGMDLPKHVKAHMAQTNARLKQMADAAGLEIVFPDRLPNTRLAHEATEYANRKGKGLLFHKKVFNRFYAKGEDIGQWRVLQEAAVEVGLDADEMKLEVESGKYTQIVRGQVEEAAQTGIDGVPTYVLNEEYVIVGAQPYENFIRALTQIQQEKDDQS